MVCLIVAALTLGVGTSVPQAASGGTIPGGIIAGVSFGQPETPGSTGSTCTWRKANPHDAHLGRGGEVSRLIDERRYWLYERRCGARDELVWVPEMTTSTLAEQAAAQVRRLLPPLRVHLAPPHDRGVVHVPHWFWVAPGDWQPVEATAWVPHEDGVLWATTRAVPTHLRFDPGEASGEATAHCQGPGDVWTPDRGDQAWSPCSLRYRRPSTVTDAGAFAATVALTWTTSWQAGDGSGGSLSPLITSTNVPIEVHEIHALVSQ